MVGKPALTVLQGETLMHFAIRDEKLDVEICLLCRWNNVVGTAHISAKNRRHVHVKPNLLVVLHRVKQKAESISLESIVEGARILRIEGITGSLQLRCPSRSGIHRGANSVREIIGNGRDEAIVRANNR